MSIETKPLLFPEVLNTNLDKLNAAHGLTQTDLDWLRHISLATHTLRSAQTPPMLAEMILFEIEDNPAITLAGCFTLSIGSQTDPTGTQPVFLYTPYGGITKFDNRESLEENLDEMLTNPAKRDDLFRLLSISQRNQLNTATFIEKTRRTINGDVFTAQVESIELAQNQNALAMVDELIKLPSLTSMLDQVLNELLSNFDHRQARVALGTKVGQQNPMANKVTNSMSLSEAVLVYFHHRGWPSGHTADFVHPDITASPENARQWESAVKIAAANLTPRLCSCIETYWDATGPFRTSRRDFLSRVLSDAMRARILVMREQKQLTDAQSRELHRLFGDAQQEETLLFIGTVRLWEYEPLYVELAGSLMISGRDHYLYIPSRGFQRVESYPAFKTALLGSPMTAERKETLYELLSLEERNLFLRFKEPQVSRGPMFTSLVSEFLANAIIGKQTKNLQYALEMSRQDDIDVHALVDKALDIRTLINENLLTQKTDGHWSTQPYFYGERRPSNFMADKVQRMADSYTSVDDAFNTLFSELQITNELSLRHGLRALRPELTNVFSIGIRAEAELRALNRTLPAAARDVIEAVFFHDSDYPDREQRSGVRGFRPDVYSLKLARTKDGQTTSLPLANCFLLTERGGLDTPYSGMGILWSPADGLQVFPSIELVTKQLNRNLLDPRKRFGLLANLTPSQRKPHGRYQIEGYELIEDNVLLNRMNSFIKFLEAEHGYLSTLKTGEWQLTGPALRKSLEALLNNGAPTNLTRATQIAQTIRWRHKLPAWLGTASLEDQRLHIELLEQYKNSVSDGKDYLDGIEPLHTYASKRLKALMDARFGKNDLDPATIQITPNLALAGPASTLTDFALNHVNVTQGTGFRVSSTSTQKLPDDLNEAAVRQLLLSLDIPTTYKKQVVEALSGTATTVQQRKQRFGRQLPWQLLQHAHALHLQQRLSPTAFDLIRQVLDMPDAIARRAVRGANALIRPLELIKTEGSAAVKALGLYLIGSSPPASGPQVLYAPYHEGHILTELRDEASVIAGFNTPGTLQDLLIRRLPDNQQAIFKNLFASTLGSLSEITLASNPIETNLLDTLFHDNAMLLPDLLAAQTDNKRQFDWETVLHLFTSGVKLVGRQLAGKLTFIETLWDSYQDFKASAEALQSHDWKDALHNFISGAAQMVSLGLLNRDDTFGLLDPVIPVSQHTPVAAPSWKDIDCTAPSRTDLQVFEATDVSLADLQKSVNDEIYKAVASGNLYAPVAGKVFQVAQTNRAWRIVHENGEGPLLKNLPDSRAWMIDPQRQTVRYGKVMSTLANSYSDYKAARSLNIEARSMAEIRQKYPHYANQIVQALEIARYYSHNTLHNLDQVKRHVPSGSRLDTLLKSFFGVQTVDTRLIQKIHAAISPICQTLADPSWELQNAHRIVIGSLKQKVDGATAFVLEPEPSGKIYLTQHFFNMGLDWYKAAVPQFFNVDAHAQGATFIHEISHQLFDTLDLVYLDAALPFPDLISTATHFGQLKHDAQNALQRDGLSLTTPRTQLFMAWDADANMLKSLELFPHHKETAKEILKITGTKTMDQARDAFLNAGSADKRIDVLLRNADSVTLLICELGRQLDPVLPYPASPVLERP